MTLQEAADALGVHYMTAYRYVRQGQLDAVKQGGVWRVTDESLDAFRSGRDADAPARRRPAPWSDRLEARLVAGDAAGAWGVLESAMSAGSSVPELYLDVLAPAMHSIGARWEQGEIDVAIEHRASGIATRLVARLGTRCVRRGRSRGTILLGSPAGERHGLVLAMLSDLLRFEGWDVSDLGSDTPATSFVSAASDTDDLVAIGLSVTHADHLDACARTCRLLREAGLGVPVIVGGQAVRDADHARELGADAFATDTTGMIVAIDQLGAA